MSDLHQENILNSEEYKALYSKLSRETRNKISTLSISMDEKKILEGFTNAPKENILEQKIEIPSNGEMANTSPDIFLHILVITLAVIANSVIIPTFNVGSFAEIEIYTKVVWRYEAMLLFLLPLHYLEYKANQEVMEGFYSSSNLKKIVPISICHFLWLIFTVGSLQLTDSSHSYVLSNLGIISIFIYYKFYRYTMTNMEYFGLIITVLGGILLIGTASLTNVSYSFLGDFIAILASIFSAGYIILIKPKLQNTPIFSLIFLVIFINLILATLAGLFFGNFSLFSFNKVNGFFGWLHFDNFFFILLIFGLLTGILATVGYALGIKHYSAQFITSSMMIEPISAILIMSAITNISIGFRIFLSGFFIIIGILLSLFGSLKKETLI